MIFHRLDGFIPDVSPRIFSKTIAYVDGLSNRRRQIAQRNLSSYGAASPGVRFLKYLMGQIDIDHLRKLPDDYARYMNVLRGAQDDLESPINPIATKVLHKNVFIAPKGGTHCNEIIFAGRQQDYMSGLPFGRGWAAWRAVKPLRMIDCNSKELTFNTHTSQIIFSVDLPTRAVFSIDVVSLILQYVNFLKSDPKAIDFGLERYLHTYVMSGLLEDLQALWVRNRYQNLLSNPDIVNNKHALYNEHIYDSTYGYVGVQYGPAMEELISYMGSLKNGNIYPKVFLASLPLTDVSVSSYVRSIQSEVSVENLQQLTWVEYMRDISWVEIIFAVYRLGERTLDYKNLIRMLRRDLPIIYSTRFWNNLNVSSLQQEIRQDIEARMKDVRSQAYGIFG